MTTEQIHTAARAILEANLEFMSAKTGLSIQEVKEAIANGVPNAVKMFAQLTFEGIKAAEAHYA